MENEVKVGDLVRCISWPENTPWYSRKTLKGNVGTVTKVLGDSGVIAVFAPGIEAGLTPGEFERA